jgi:hypothetical protein
MPDLSFYSTAAQVIPLIFVALAFESRSAFVPLSQVTLKDPELDSATELREQAERALSESPESDTLTQQVALARTLEKHLDRKLDHTTVRLNRQMQRATVGASLATMLALLAGEAGALGVLRSNSEGSGDAAIVGVALAAGSFWLIFQLVNSQLERMDATSAWSSSRRFLTSALLTLPLLATAAGVYLS